MPQWPARARGSRHWIAAVCVPWVAATLACTGDVSGLGLPCERDDDCAPMDLVCQLAPDAELDVVGDANLECGRPDAQALPVGVECDGPNDCDHRLCALSGYCVAPCLADTDCAQTGHCGSLFVTDDTSPGALRVDACVQSVALDEGIEVERMRLRDAVTGMADELTLPATREPTLFVLEHSDDMRFPLSETCRPPLCPLSLRSLDADSTPLFDADGTGQGPPLVPIGTPSSAFPLTIYLGNSIEPPHSDAGYALGVRSEVPGDVMLTTLSGAPSGTRLNLNIFYVTERWGPQGSRGPETLAAALEVVDRIFAPADLYIGDVRQRRLPELLVDQGDTFDEPGGPGAGFDPLARRFGVWAELPALLALSAGATNSAVNVFLVEDIAGTPSGSVRGLSGGTPGPFGMHGTGASGVVVAIGDVGGNPAALGRTLAHELAHYLGLFHTSERDGSVLDPLDDTPACAASQDANGDAVLSASECLEHGARNLMFWAESTGTELTADQITILRRALVLQ